MTRITAGSGRRHRQNGQVTEKKRVNPLVRHHGSDQPSLEIASAQLLLDGMYSQYIHVRNIRFLNEANLNYDAHSVSFLISNQTSKSNHVPHEAWSNRIEQVKIINEP